MFSLRYDSSHDILCNDNRSQKRVNFFPGIDLTMNCIASSLPGRIRLRHVDLRDGAKLAALAGTVKKWRHIRSVSGNPRAGSLLVHYDESALDPERISARLSATLAKVLGNSPREPVSQPAPVRATPRRSLSRRARANRWAKRVMVGSLAASVALGVARHKRWHILTGWTFVGALAVHLWVYRKHIFR